MDNPKMTELEKANELAEIVDKMKLCQACKRTYRLSDGTEQPISFEYVCIHHSYQLKEIGL